MTLSQLRDRVARARAAAPDGAVVDPYLRALVELAQLAEDRILAQDRHTAAMLAGDRAVTERCRMLDADASLRIALSLPGPRAAVHRRGDRRSLWSAFIAALRRGRA